MADKCWATAAERVKKLYNNIELFYSIFMCMRAEHWKAIESSRPHTKSDDIGWVWWGGAVGFMFSICDICSCSLVHQVRTRTATGNRLNESQNRKTFRDECGSGGLRGGGYKQCITSWHFYLVRANMCHFVTFEVGRWKEFDMQAN